MRQLWKILVVSVDKRILLDTSVVAESREEALQIAGTESVLCAHRLRPSDAVILAVAVGSVQPKFVSEHMK